MTRIVTRRYGQALTVHFAGRLDQILKSRSKIDGLQAPRRQDRAKYYPTQDRKTQVKRHQPSMLTNFAGGARANG